MGGAFAAIADDANAIFANPAGLGWAQHQELISGYGKLYMGLSDGSNLATSMLGFMQPIYVERQHCGTLGIGWVNFSLTQYYSEDTAILAYGKELAPSWLAHLYGGLAIKSLRHTFRIGSDPTAAANPFFSAYGTSSSNFSLDFGFLYRLRRRFSLSYGIRNFNKPDMALNSNDPVPSTTEMGLAWHHLEGNLALQINQEQGLQSLHTGAERWFFDGRLGVRAGVIAGNHELRQGTLGFGLRTQSFSLDYSARLALSGIESTQGTHRLSFSVPFGERLKKPLREDAEPLEAQEALLLREELRKSRALAQEREDRVRELEAALRNLEAKTGIAASVTYSSETLNAEQLSQDQLAGLRQELEGIRTTLERTRQEARSGQIRAQTVEKAIEEGHRVKQDRRHPRIHRSRPGDTLKSIAKEYYGNPDLWPEIYRANEDRLGRGGDIVTDQILIIPPIEKGIKEENEQ